MSTFPWRSPVRRRWKPRVKKLHKLPAFDEEEAEPSPTACNLEVQQHPLTFLLCLPDESILTIFKFLGDSSQAFGMGCRESYRLSETCRRINQLFRKSFVVKLICGCMDKEENEMTRALLRFPATHTLEVRNNCNISTMLQGLDESGTNIRSFSFLRANISHAQLKVLLKTYPALKELQFDGCPGISPVGVSRITKSLRQLTNLSLRNCPGKQYRASHHVLRPGELISLTQLDISNCTCFDTDEAFYSLGALVELEQFSLSNSEVSTGAFIHCIQRMEKLTDLDISGTLNIATRPSIFPFLPSSLVYLNLRGSSALTDETKALDLEHLSALRHLTLIVCERSYNLSSLEPVSCLTQGLRTLNMSDSTLRGNWQGSAFKDVMMLRRLCLENCELRDGWPLSTAKSLPNVEEMYISAARGMAEELTSLAEMKSLKKLVVDGCSNIGNPTARAVGSLPQLEFLIMTNSMVDEFGAEALQRGACKNSLTYLKLHTLPQERRRRIARLGPESYSQSLRWAQRRK